MVTMTAVSASASLITWDQVVAEHFTRVYRLALRLTGNPPDAEDLAQDTFVRVFGRLHDFRPQNMEGWLHRITTNLFLDRMRRRQRIRMDALADAVVERLESDEPLPDKALSDAMFEPDVEAALNTLRPEFRTVIMLCDVEQLSYEQIAEVLGIKIGTVQSRIHRGRAQLRDALAHRAPRADRSRPGGETRER